MEGPQCEQGGHPVHRTLALYVTEAVVWARPFLCITPAVRLPHRPLLGIPGCVQSGYQYPGSGEERIYSQINSKADAPVSLSLQPLQITLIPKDIFSVLDRQYKPSMNITWTLDLTNQVYPWHILVFFKLMICGFSLRVSWPVF